MHGHGQALGLVLECSRSRGLWRGSCRPHALSSLVPGSVDEHGPLTMGQATQGSRTTRSHSFRSWLGVKKNLTKNFLVRGPIKSCFSPTLSSTPSLPPHLAPVGSKPEHEPEPNTNRASTFGHSDFSISAQSPSIFPMIRKNYPGLRLRFKHRVSKTHGHKNGPPGSLGHVQPTVRARPNKWGTGHCRLSWYRCQPLGNKNNNNTLWQFAPTKLLAPDEG